MLYKTECLSIKLFIVFGILSYLVADQVITLWAIRIPISWWLSVEIGTVGIWWGIPLAWIIGLTISYFYYKSGRWKRKAVVKHKTNLDDTKV